MEINGIAHIQLSVTDLEVSRAFYRRLLVDCFGMHVQYDEPEGFYCIGGRTGIALTPVWMEFMGERHHQRKPGLHHICFRARSREDIDGLHTLLQEWGVTIIHPPEDGPWAPGYYSILFEDPDGIRLEVNYVPGKGNLDPAVALPKGRSSD